MRDGATGFTFPYGNVDGLEFVCVWLVSGGEARDAIRADDLVLRCSDLAALGSVAKDGVGGPAAFWLGVVACSAVVVGADAGRVDVEAACVVVERVVADGSGEWFAGEDGDGVPGAAVVEVDGVADFESGVFDSAGGGVPAGGGVDDDGVRAGFE